MSFQQAVIVLTLFGYMSHVHATNVTSLENIDKSTNINVNSSLPVGPVWGRTMLKNWLFSRNTSSAPFGVNTSNNTVIRQLRFTPMNAVLSSFIYSLSIVPIFFALTKVFTPAPHGFYGRRKRALVNESHLYRHLPLLNREETRRFLSLFETTLQNRKIHSEQCKKFYSCQVFRSIRSGSLPKLPDFEYALLNVFGIVAERYDYKVDLIPTVKMYYEIATNAFKGISCSQMYPCYLGDRNATALVVPSVHRKSPHAHPVLQVSSAKTNSSSIATVRRRHPSSRRLSAKKRTIRPD